MKVILFDLGDTLEHDGALRPGTLETLSRIGQLRDGNQERLEMGLVSDFQMPSEHDDMSSIRQRYVEILEKLQIRIFFEPIEQRVTLSTDVGVFKPDPRVFRAA